MQPDSNRVIESKEAAQIRWLPVIACAIPVSVFLVMWFVWRELFFIVMSGGFAVFVVAVLAVQISQSRMRKKFGNVVLQLEGPEPAIGGRLAGSIALSGQVEAASVLVEFICCRVTYDSKGTQYSSEVWARRPRLPVENGAVAISFDIPAKLQPTRLRNPHNPGDLMVDEFWEWSLRVYAELPGPDFDYHYPIIVQRAMPGTEAAMPRSTDAAAATPHSTGTPVPGTSPAAHDASSTWGLVAANLVPVAGIAFWGWKVQDMMILYWIETVVVLGFATLYAMLVHDFAPAVAEANEQRGELDLDQSPGPNMLAMKLGGAALYFVLFGGLCVWIGSWMAAIFFEGASLLTLISGYVRERGAIFAVFAIAGCHGYAFFRNYNDDMLGQPLLRVFVMATMLMLFPVVSMVGFNQVVTVLVFVAVKVGVEIWLRRREREQSAGNAAPRARRARR